MGHPAVSRRERALAAPLLVAYWCGGWSMFIGSTPSAVRDTLGGGWHQAWVVMLLIGPPICVAGALWHDQWVGTWLRIAGSLIMAGALGAYLAGVVQAFGWLTFSVWLAMGLVVATLVMVALDAYRVVRINRAAKEG